MIHCIKAENSLTKKVALHELMGLWDRATRI